MKNKHYQQQEEWKDNLTLMGKRVIKVDDIIMEFVGDSWTEFNADIVNSYKYYSVCS